MLVEILRDRQTENPLDTMRQILDREEVLAMQQAVRAVYTSDETLRYLGCLAEVADTHEMLSLGLSPRGVIALHHMAKACAFVRRRTGLCDPRGCPPARSLRTSARTA